MPDTEPRVTAAQWRFLILLVLSVWVNYIDRANLSVAAPQLRSELSLDPSDLGILLSAFFWTYALMQLAAGWLVDRFDVNWVFALGYLLWSSVTAATGLVSSLNVLLVCRLILGTGESVSYPAYSKILVHHFPRHRLALANAMIDAGSKMGPALGTLLGGLLVAHLGWRTFFIALGLVSLLWLVPWALWAPRRAAPAAPSRASGPGVPFHEILRLRTAWGTFFGHFAGNYYLYFLVTWLPSYLVMERKFSMERMAVLGSLPYVVIAASAIGAGWLSDHLIQRGILPSRIRILFVAAGLGGSIVIVLVPLAPAHGLAIAALLLACIPHGFYSANLWAITQTIAGTRAAGMWSGLQNCFANMAGVVAPALTGFVAARTGKFYLAFVAVASVQVLGVCAYLFLVRRAEPMRWRES